MNPPSTQQRPNALQVAKYLVKLANEEQGVLMGKASEDPMRDEIRCDMTNLKLQKVLYFAQAAHLGINGSPLFDDEIEAWGLGPVVPVVYEAFKDHGSSVIGANRGSDEGIDPYHQYFLQQVWAEFGKFSAAQLVDMTHEHAPWRIAKEQGKKIISKEDMKVFYRSIFRPVDATPITA